MRILFSPEKTLYVDRTPLYAPHQHQQKVTNMVNFKKLLKEGKNITPIPSKSWDKYASKVNYPTINTTYEIDPAINLPIEDKDQTQRYLIQTKQGKIMIWESTLVELATILKENDYQVTQFAFYRNEGDRRMHVKEIKEKF